MAKGDTEGRVRQHLRLDVASILLGLSVCLTACSVPVAQGLAEQEANQVVVALQRGGIAASKELEKKGDKGWAVTVSRPDAANAVAVLATQGPPSTNSPSLLESLSGSALIPSPKAELARLMAGTSGEIERTLRELDGIVSARVHLASPSFDALVDGSDAKPVTASVLIRYRDGTQPVSISEVQQLVAGAVSGLKSERVSVVLKAVPTQLPQLGPARMGPLSVSRGSLLPLRWILGTAIATNLVLFAFVVGLWRKLRQLRA